MVLQCMQTGIAPPFPDLRLSLTKMEDEGMGKGKMQAVSTSQRPAPPGAEGGHSGDAPPVISYAEERGKRVLYSDPQLHLTVSFLLYGGGMGGAMPDMVGHS